MIDQTGIIALPVCHCRTDSAPCANSRRGSTSAGVSALASVAVSGVMITLIQTTACHLRGPQGCGAPQMVRWRYAVLQIRSERCRDAPHDYGVVPVRERCAHQV